MTYRGHIRNGVAIIDAAVTLPEGTPVRIEVEQSLSDFWDNKSAAELAREQGISPIRTAEDLAGEWPDDDSVDDFLSLVREARR
jgi:hypothetical protein